MVDLYCVAEGAPGSCADHGAGTDPDLADPQVAAEGAVGRLEIAQQEPALVGDGYEVVEVFSAPLSAFLPSAPIETVTAERDGYRLRYGGYQLGRHHVWGATAMMLGRFGAYLATARGA